MISTNNLAAGSINGSQAVSQPPSQRVVPKPVPRSQSEDPRKYQIDQIKKRFDAQLTTLQDGTSSLLFRLKPSDPDFPFELSHLICDLQIPPKYPDRPSQLRVKNKEIPRGFAINIERGWDNLALEKTDASLLALVYSLDKRLETLLTEQKTDTVTLVSFKDTRHLEASAVALGSDAGTSIPTVQPQEPDTQTTASRPYIPERSFTKDEIAQAKARRAQEIRQLEARMGKTPLYQKSADGIVYTLTLEPKRRSALPLGLQQVQSVQLIIPLLYPLQSLRILLNEVESEDAEPLEEIFATKATQQAHMPLTSHINYLAQNIHVLAKQAEKLREEREAATRATALPKEKGHTDTEVRAQQGGRSHVVVIPRPPEWVMVNENGESDSSDEFSYSEEEESDEGGAVVLKTTPKSVSGTAQQQVERGTAISFPSIELHGIELFQIAILSVSVKCERCKTLNDVSGLKPDVEKPGSCNKCATAFTVRFRQEMVHQQSTRAGLIDVSGCKVADMLPSTFIPTCSTCSTPSHGLVSVRGDATTNVCRECHGKFTFKIPDVRLTALSYGDGGPLPPRTGPRQRQEKLGLHAGEPLPARGICPHYKRSHRWFRFSCCSKVHPCDKCHDENEDHGHEWANRMLCGWCSREQNYAPEACGFCGRSVIGKKGRGFWEGGKGTRDRTLMSRKDKRKYRRVGGGPS